ncbi:MAG: CDP-glycerol glycerophosphotransferase family protein [Sporolactobacillus sp.]
MKNDQIYLENYWRLYELFLQNFDSLTYKHIPLALLSNFYRYISPALKERMKRETFFKLSSGEALTHKTKTGQPFFEEEMKKMVSETAKAGDTKILLHLDYLRWSPEHFVKFDPRHTLVLLRGNLKQYNGLPTINKNAQRHAAAPDVVAALTKQAAMLFDALPVDHPLQESHLKTVFLKDLAGFISAIDALTPIFQKQPLAMIVVGTTEDLDSRILVLEGRRRGIPSLCLQHGALMGEEAFFPVLATHQGVYGKYERDWYLAKGCSGSQIVVTGHPRFDSIFNPNKPIHQESAAVLKLSANKKTILVATQPFAEAVLNKIISELLKQSDLQVIVKPHPWEIGKGKLAVYHAFERYPNFRLLARSPGLYDVLPAVDGVVTLTSTVGLEAMLFGKPVWIGENTDDRQYSYYEALKSSYLTDPVNLAKQVISSLENPQLLKEVSSQCQAFSNTNYPVHQSMDLLFQLFYKLTGTRFDLKAS